MEFLFTLVAELVLEFVLAAFFELLAEIGLRSFGEPFRQRESRNPVLAAIGYCMFGALLGGLSLLVFPNSFVRSESLHGISLVISPVLAGLFMSLIGRIRKQQGKSLLRLDSFIYGFLFALPIAAVRFLYAN